MGKGEDKRASIIAQQAARQETGAPGVGGVPGGGKRATNWAATAPVRPRRGRPVARDGAPGAPGAPAGGAPAGGDLKTPSPFGQTRGRPPR